MTQWTLESAQRPVDAAEAIEALDRALGSRAFARSKRSREFLAYVVTEALAGRGERLTERTVARAALGRGASFDGRDDASVRVQAGRVRTSLQAYYTTTGASDPIRISVPRGSYVPEFERHVVHESQVATVPGVAVARLTASEDEPAGLIARSLTETLVQHLARHPDIRVVGPTGPRTEGTGAVGAVSSVLEGHVSARAGQLMLTARLLDSQSGEVLWTTDAVVTVEDFAGFEAEERWSREIAATIGDPSGQVVRQEARRSRPSGVTPELAARLAFYSYLDRGTLSSITEAIPVVDAALDSGHRTAGLLSIRAALANACVAYGMGDKETELDRAAALAREALTVDGSYAHAHLVLGSVARDRRQWDVAIEHAETAALLAPHHPSYLVGAGITLSGSGEWDRGAELIREAHRLHPGLAGHTHAWLAMGHLVHEDYARALAEASLLPEEDGYVWGPLYRAMALAALGHEEQSRAEAARVRDMRPEVLDDLGGYLHGRMRLTDEQLARLVALL